MTKYPETYLEYLAYTQTNGGVMNSDKTPFNPPVPTGKALEYFEKQYEIFKSCKMGWGYGCIYCSKCRYGENFKVPEEYTEALKEYHEKVLKYTLEHNIHVTDILIPFNDIVFTK